MKKENDLAKGELIEKSETITEEKNENQAADPNEKADQETDQEKAKDAPGEAEKPLAEDEKIINYRVSLRNALSEKDSLEYRISSLKTQLKACEKNIENINRQFVTGDFTGDLFADQKAKEKQDMAFSTFGNRDEMSFDDFLTECGVKLSACFENPAGLGQHGALLDFITSNPDTATAKMLYTKAIFTKLEPGDKDFDSFDIPLVDPELDFILFFVADVDRAKYADYTKKWASIADDFIAETEKTAEKEDTDAHPKSKRGRKNSNA